MRKDVSIAITFSEPMNKETTQSAYSSADLPANAVVFAWSADDTVLTIDPASDLSYVADTVPPSAAPKKYSFSFATTASDRAGNGLVSAFAASFATSRQIAQTLVASVWRLEYLGSGSLPPYAQACTEQAAAIGDQTGFSGMEDARFMILFQFDLSALIPSVQSFTEATVRAQQAESMGTPFGANQLGNVVIDHTNFDPIDGNALKGAPLQSLGVFSSSPTPGPRSLNVLASVTEDHAQRLARSYRSQYRLSFSRETNGNLDADQTFFSCDASSRPTLTLKYLAP